MTQTLSTIRLATPADEPELLHLFRAMHAEGGMRRLDVDRVREMFGRAFARKGGILAVIGVPGHIRAMMFLLLTKHWYTHDVHIEELFNFVHPDHRNSDYSRLMIEYAKKCSDEMSTDAGEKIPLVMGVLTNKRMAAKVRLYRRFFGMPYGAFFLHNAPWVTSDLCEEDFWHIPKLAWPYFRKKENADREQTRTNGVRPRVEEKARARA